MVIGSAFLVLILCVVGLWIFLATKGAALDKESRQYVDTVVPLIVSKWNLSELENRASPEFRRAVGKNDLTKLFDMFRKLGSLKEYNGSQGQANISVTIKDGIVISALYLAKAEFETGPAEMKISLIKRGRVWQIFGFQVNSKVFLQ